jgi:hypothetical protein
VAAYCGLTLTFVGATMLAPLFALFVQPKESTRSGWKMAARSS